MSWKHDVGGWATNGRDTAATRRTTAGGSVLESVLSGVTARASPSLGGTRPRSPLLSKSSPSRTPATEVASRASPASSLSTQKTAAPSQKQNSFIPKGWASSTATKVPAIPKTSKVVFAERIDDRSLTEGAAKEVYINQSNLTLPSLTARSRVSTNSSIAVADTATKSKWVTIFGGSNGEFQHVLHHLSSRCGPIRRVHWPAASFQCNWLHVQFVDTVGAAAAIDSPLQIALPAIGGDGYVTVNFAVSWCADVALIAYYHTQDAEEEEAQKLLTGSLAEDDENTTTHKRQDQDTVPERAEAIHPSNLITQRNTARPVGALERIAKLSESSKRFSLDASSAFTHSSAAANRNFHNSFSSSAGGNNRRSTNGSTLFSRAFKSDARNGNVYVPVPSRKGLRTAAELWGPADVPFVPSTVDTIISVVVSPVEWAARWWYSEDVPIAQSATSVSSSFRLEDEPPSFFSFLWGDSYDDPPVPMTTKKTKNIVLHHPIISTEQEPLTNDIRTVIRPLPWYLDYGRIVSLLFLVAVGIMSYYLIGGPFLEAFLEAISGLISFVFSTLGLVARGGSGVDNYPTARASGPNAPRWEYLYESNFANENNRNDFYAF